MEPIDYMRNVGRLASQTLDYIEPYIVADITTEEINTLVHEFTLENNAIPAPLNYHGFPKSVCTSVNHVVCHGIPGSKKLVNGDIINVDVTPILDGWHGDSSRMFYIGKPSIKARKLVEKTYEAMMKGIEVIKPGISTRDIGYAIQECVGNQYSIVKEYCGHGLGQEFHTPPQIYHHALYETGSILEEGMFITVEPMINVGKQEVKELKDGWTVVTRDRSLSAQFEHTIYVSSSGYEILTLSGNGL